MTQPEERKHWEDLNKRVGKGSAVTCAKEHAELSTSGRSDLVSVPLAKYRLCTYKLPSYTTTKKSLLKLAARNEIHDTLIEANRILWLDTARV